MYLGEKLHISLQACCAFSFITIPSILGAGPATRLALSAHSAQVAYACRCFGQAEDAVRAAIRYLLETAAGKYAGTVLPDGKI